jgi:hypothetical protein
VAGSPFDGAKLGGNAHWLAILTCFQFGVLAQADRHRPEVKNMGKSFADKLLEEASKKRAVRERREGLLRCLQLRFGKLPPETVKRIKATTSIRRLDAWLDRVVMAPTLADMGIGSPTKAERKE